MTGLILEPDPAAVERGILADGAACVNFPDALLG